MPIGPGRYDDLCTYVREKAHAQGVIVFVARGDKGDGFSVQAPLELTLQLPEILRSMARQIEESMRAGEV